MIKNIGQGQGYFRLNSPQNRLEPLVKVDVKSREAEDSILLRGDSVELRNQLTDASNDTSYAKELKERINLQKPKENILSESIKKAKERLNDIKSKIKPSGYYRITVEENKN